MNQDPFSPLRSLPWQVWPAMVFLTWSVAAAAPRGLPADAGSTGPLAPAVSASDLDQATFREWVAGRERSLHAEKTRKGDERPATPDGVVSGVVSMGQKPAGNSMGIVYGIDKDGGPRHLRIGFTKPRKIGAVLAGGGGSLSVLSPTAAYPGDLANEEHWIPAERVVDGRPGVDEVGDRDCALWTLPAGTSTRAIRFSHQPQATDKQYSCHLTGLTILPERFLNVAPAAQVVAANPQLTQKLVDGAVNINGHWSNWDDKNQPLPLAEKSAAIMLVWRDAVTVRGLALLFAGAQEISVEEYTGPTDRHPREARESDWRTIETFKELKHGYPATYGPSLLDFKKTVSTRGLRLLLRKAAVEGHPHMKDSTKGGRRAWIGEILALRPIGEAPLAAGWPAEPRDTAAEPPLKISVDAPADGFVTLVIDDEAGRRVRNLAGPVPVKAGKNTFAWDGLDDLGRDVGAAEHGLYHVPGAPVKPGTYAVNGIFRKAIDLRWEFGVYNPGTPPWDTADNTGSWLANHAPPQAACFVPAERSPDGKPRMYLGAFITEGPHGFIWTDLDGTKLGGQRWIGGTWTAAPYIAHDAGPTADKNEIVFVASVWRTEKKDGEAELRLTAIGNDKQRPVLKHQFPFTAGDRPGEEIGGFAAWNNRLAVSLTLAGKVMFVDGASGKIEGELTLPSPRGLAVDRDGRLLAVSENRVVRLPEWTAEARVEPLISTGLEAPQMLAVGADGAVFVSDHGESHQVKVFTAKGGLVATFGKAGKPASGPYDPDHMNMPYGIALDDRGRLWVTEKTIQPKRVSVWSADGRLWKAFYGPAQYGGGGRLDGDDPTRFYYQGMEFALDWKTGESSLASVLFLYTDWPQKPPARCNAPDAVLCRDGRRYFTNCFNSNPTGGNTVAHVFRETGGRLLPCAAMGHAKEWDLLKEQGFAKRWPEGVTIDANKHKDPVFFVWSDANDDGTCQPDEVEMTRSSSGGVVVMPDLSFVVSRLDGKTTRFEPLGFSVAGSPKYAVSSGRVLAEGVEGPGSSGGDQALVHADGWTVLTLGVKPFHKYSISGVYQGQPRWSYPNLWPGLHAGHSAPEPDRPGMLIAPTRLLGWFFSPPGSDAGPMWCVNGNHGNIYVFTADGLFVGQLFEDMRQGKLWAMPRGERDMPLNGLTLKDENFWPSLTQDPSGRVYLVDGGRSSLVRVDGLETTRRLPPQTISVSAGDLEKCREWMVAVEAKRQKRTGRESMVVRTVHDAPKVDGDVAEWTDASWAVIDKRGARAYFNSTSKPYDVQASLAVSGDRLYGTWRTGDPNLLDNSGENLQTLFKTGGCLDLQLGTDPAADPARKKPAGGDLRLLVTLVNKKTVAMLYRAVVPGTKEADQVSFTSPVSTIWFDKVEDVSAQVELAGNKEGDYEISVPLAILGLRPQEGMRLRGDIGILRGQKGQTQARVLWANKATGITADIPSEAALEPALWGWLEFK